jgi:hypothetical protein
MSLRVEIVANCSEDNQFNRLTIGGCRLISVALSALKKEVL